MPTQIAIGLSQHTDTHSACQEAFQDIEPVLAGTSVELIVTFSTTHHEPQIINQRLVEQFPHAKIVGCSTAGIIHSDQIVTRGLGILALASDEIKFGVGLATDISPQSLRLAGAQMARNMITDFGQQNRSLCLFFVDGTIADSSSLLKGMQEILGTVFPIVGAGSCDDFRYEHNFQFFDTGSHQMAACGLLLGGQAQVGISGRHGWRPLGKPRAVTSVNNNIIMTIDGKKAASLYEEYFDQAYENLRSNQLGHMSILYPLGVYLEENHHFLLRYAVDILENGGIVCQGSVPEGARVHIMIGNKDSCKMAALEAANEAQKSLMGKKAKLVIIVESMARLKLLGRGAFTEITHIKQVFGRDVPIFGMYANGEICPFESREQMKRPYLQNESIVILAIA